MPDFEKLARPCLRKLQPYIPGKPIEEIKQRFGLARVIKLASNENPLGPSRRALEAVSAALGEVNRYPEGGSTRLRQAIAASLGLEPARILVGSGSDEIIELIAKTFLDKDDELVASEHAFIRYKMAGAVMEARVIETRMAAGYRHDLPAMARAVTARTKIVFIANPNNPTGTHVTRAELAEFLDRVPPRVLVAVDEAYFEYAQVLPDYPDAVALRRQGHPNVVSFRTFSKIHGLAGLRVGYAVADPAVVGLMDRIRPPFNVTIPSQAGCEAALADEGHVRASRELVRENLAWLGGELERAGIEFVPSAANFVLIRTRTGGAAVFEGLLRKGLIVRPMGEYGFPEHVRVTIGTREEMEMLLAALLEVDGRR
jgi:histidinol-phosphate aminotransferase